jgi:hypothetical protein
MTLILAAQGSRIRYGGNTATGWKVDASSSLFLLTTELFTIAAK